MGANVPVVEQSDYHYNARTYIQAAITNVINGSDLDTELHQLLRNPHADHIRHPHS